MRPCPLSGEEMKHETIHGVTVDRSSRGIWLDKGEFFQITERVREETGLFERFVAGLKQLAPATGRYEERGEGTYDRDLPCPVCGAPMDDQTYQDVHIDRCTAHGVWLDSGELELIIQRLKSDPAFLDGARMRLTDLEL